jgi:hydrogenase/urease accessory protein HupE
MKKTFWTMAVLSAPFVALAHPGHGETEGFTITHYFTEPIHAVATILAVVGILALVTVLRRRFSGNK